MEHFRVGDRVYFARQEWHGIVVEVLGMKSVVSWEDWDGKIGGVDTRDLIHVRGPGIQLDSCSGMSDLGY